MLKKNAETMKSKIPFLLFVALLSFFSVSCSKDDDQVIILPHGEQQQSLDLPMGDAYIFDSSYQDNTNIRVYNFAYPSVDPYGNPIMLSATISMCDDVSRESPANGLILYNHQTIYRKDQCPSRGGLSLQSMAKGLGLITISPDYYGFGVTEHHHQAYCISLCNARASIDALFAAKQLLTELGYSWEENLFNVGFSQGAQTSVAVLRLAAEHYPDLEITYTFAGAGTYDLPLTYRHFIEANSAGMPCTVVSVLLAYNEFKRLGFSNNDMFLEPVLGHIDDWILSKCYSRQEIDAFIGPLSISEYLTSAMLDTSSSSSRIFMAAFDSDNLCHGWSPRGNERIMLFHSSRDVTVPVTNTQRLYDFLIANGVQDIDLQIRDIDGTDSNPAHQTSALMFGLLALQKVKCILGIE